MRVHMAKRTTPHTQSADIDSERPDAVQNPQVGGTVNDIEAYPVMEGAQAGGNRAPNKNPRPRGRHKTEPPMAAYEGSISTRTPKSQGQGITPRSSKEENARQEKVVKDRPDAQAGVNHAK